MNKVLFLLLLLCLFFVVTVNGVNKKKKACRKSCVKKLPECGKRKICRKSKPVRKCITQTCTKGKLCSHVMLHQ